MKRLIGSDEVSSLEIPILNLSDPLVQQSDPVKDDHYFCPCICNLVLKVCEAHSLRIIPAFDISGQKLDPSSLAGCYDWPMYNASQ